METITYIIFAIITITGLFVYNLIPKTNKPICNYCYSPDIHEGYYTRGWNNLCGQACGDNGHWCNECCRITFDRTLDEYKKGLPNWCTPFDK